MADTKKDRPNPPVHFLNRDVSPAMISCGKMVSRPSQYTSEVRRASCANCADAHPSLTYEQRVEIIDNADDRLGRTSNVGAEPQPTRAYRRYPAPWEACACKGMESRSWDAWFKKGNAKPVLKRNKTLHAPKRHGGCEPVAKKSRAA